MINSEYLQKLNNFQKEAVLHTSGPLLIVAGAGSGKTKVLTSRIANILEKNLAFPKKCSSRVDETRFFLNVHILVVSNFATVFDITAHLHPIFWRFA